MTILQSLKKLHKKMTGQDSTSKTIGGVITDLEENYTSTGGEQAITDSKPPLILACTVSDNIVSLPSGITVKDIYDAAIAGRYVAIDAELIIELPGVVHRAPLQAKIYDVEDGYSVAFGVDFNVSSTMMYLNIGFSEDATTATISKITWSVG